MAIAIDLANGQIDVAAVAGTTGTAGAKQLDMTYSYIPETFSGLQPPKITYTNSIIVPNGT